jgi:two-component system LytT family response regulator
MIKAILVDDERHCLATLQLLLQKHCPEVQILKLCYDAETALQAIRSMKPSVVFLDIQMPFMNGFELLEQLDEISFAIVFTTSFDEYAIQAIHYSAMDYLLKPIDSQGLKAAVQKVKNRKQLPSSEQFELLLQQLQHKGAAFSKIAVPTSDGFELLFVEQVLRCEADDTYTYFYLKNGVKIIACRSLKEVEMQLRPFSFFLRVHHSFIVNLNEVSRYVRGDGGYVIMSDGASINVSRSRKEALLKCF